MSSVMTNLLIGFAVGLALALALGWLILNLTEPGEWEP
jgi:hypothetical protein